MAADDVGGVGAAEDIHLSEELAADGGVGISVDDLESVNGVGAFVSNLVDGATVTMSKDVKILDVSGRDGSSGGGGSGGIGRKR